MIRKLVFVILVAFLNDQGLKTVYLNRQLIDWNQGYWLMSEDGLEPQALLESLNDGVYAVDRDRRILYWSRSAERITGWSEKDILGKRCSDDVLSHVDKQGRPLCGSEYCPLHRSMVTGQRSDVPIVVFAQKRDGRRIPMRVSVAPVQNGSGDIIGGVETFRDASKEHYEAEHTREIQSAMLQKHLIQDQRVTFTAYYLPWGMVGGDYYATSRVDEDRLAFMLADVTGHGVAAAMYTVYLNALWQDHSHLLPEVPKLADEMHRKLSVFSDDGRFATAIFGLINLKQMSAKLTFAGGPAPLLYRSNGNLEILEGTGVPLGLPTDFDYDELDMSVGPGDCLLAFTDGALEIGDVNGKLLGTDGLVKILDEVGYPESKDFEVIEEKLLKFSDRIRFNDDLTFMETRFM